MIEMQPLHPHKQVSCIYKNKPLNKHIVAKFWKKIAGEQRSVARTPSDCEGVYFADARDFSRFCCCWNSAGAKLEMLEYENVKF